MVQVKGSLQPIKWNTNVQNYASVAVSTVAPDVQSYEVIKTQLSHLNLESFIKNRSIVSETNVTFYTGKSVC